ncbi:MAG: hypothetical protein WKF30_15165 [Pyrinomonadaceae bacterium]
MGVTAATGFKDSGCRRRPPSALARDAQLRTGAKACRINDEWINAGESHFGVTHNNIF